MTCFDKDTNAGGLFKTHGLWKLLTKSKSDKNVVTNGQINI